MEKRQKFTAEFKREAVRLLKSGSKPASVLARDLGLRRNVLYKWAQALEAKPEEAFKGGGRPKLSSDELTTLKRDNTRLKEEVDILKKAAAYFARELR